MVQKVVERLFTSALVHLEISHLHLDCPLLHLEASRMLPEISHLHLDCPLVHL